VSKIEDKDKSKKEGKAKGKSEFEILKVSLRYSFWLSLNVRL